MKFKIKYLVIGLSLVLSVLLTGCDQENERSGSVEATEVEELTSENSEDFEINNGGRVIKFEKTPERAVTLNQHVTEVMLALGLEDKMIGTAYLDDEILPEYQEAYESIPVLADQYPSQEVFLNAEPDFAYGGWSSAFSDDAVGTVESLEDFDIKAYLHQSSTMTGPKVEDIYEDVRNIAQIFQVEEKAEQLIENINDEVEQLQSQVGEIDEPLRVFVYDSGEDAPLTATQNFMTELINIAGGENIFSHIDKNWANVSWEEVVDGNPEVIVIIDYGDTTVEEKKEILLNQSSLAEVDAIQNERFAILPLSAASEGIRIPIAVESLIKSFYPEKFD